MRTRGNSPTDSTTRSRAGWTNGDAVLPAAQFDGFEGALDVELHLAATAAYPAGPNEVASWPA